MKKAYLYLIAISILLLTACNHLSTNDHSNDIMVQGNPTAKEILSKDKNADIFATIEVVYQNAEDIDWVNELELTTGKEYFEITKQTTNPEKFESGTATKLPVGTKIYNTDQGQILVAMVDGKEIRYIGLIEG